MPTSELSPFGPLIERTENNVTGMSSPFDPIDVVFCATTIAVLLRRLGMMVVRGRAHENACGTTLRDLPADARKFPPTNAL